MQPMTLEVDGQTIVVSQTIMDLVIRWIDVAQEEKVHAKQDVVQFMAGQPRRRISPETMRILDEIQRLTDQIWRGLLDENPSLDFRLRTGKEEKACYSGGGGFSQEGIDHFAKQARAVEGTTRKAIHEIFTRACREKGLAEIHSPCDPNVRGLH